jgi:YhcH/YjgK/YiaL family protein
MICDLIANAPQYASLHPAFAHCFRWLAAFDGTTPDGNHDIGMGCEARVMSYLTEPAEQRRWESHRRYLDIQYLVSGLECIPVAPIGALPVATPYDDEQDVSFYADGSAPTPSLVLEAGMFAIFFPQDAHRPNIAVTAPVATRKIVVKVPATA